MTGLVLGVFLKPEMTMAQSGAAQVLRPDRSTPSFAPNAFVRIGVDDTVTVLVKHIEFGQGPFTGLATLVAEELDADWSKVRAEHAPADANLYKNFLLGSQGTGGSTPRASPYPSNLRLLQQNLPEAVIGTLPPPPQMARFVRVWY